MAATIVSKSGVTLLFGVGAGIAAIAGYIATDDTQEFTSKKAEAYDSQGSTLAVAYFDQMADIKVTALILIATTILPEPGTTLTVASSFLQAASKTYIVEGPVSLKEKNNGFVTVEINLKRYLDNLLPS